MKKLIKVAAAAMALTLSLAACQIQPKMGHGDTVVATNGDARIYTRDVYFHIAQLLSDGQSTHIPDEEELTQILSGEGFEDVEGLTFLEALLELGLERSKGEALLASFGTNAGLSYDPALIEAIQAELDEFIPMLETALTTGERAFYQMFFLTPEEYLDRIRRESIGTNFEMSIIDSIIVDDADVQAELDENRSVYENRGVAHILLSFNENPEVPLEELMELAESILARAEAGENFADLVTTYSQDYASVPNGGLYVINIREQFVPEFMDWTFFEAEVGDFGIVETVHGIHIMHLVSAELIEGIFEDIRFGIQIERAMPTFEQMFEEAGDNWVVDRNVLNNMSLDSFRRQ
ncbi:MAG: peptidylprolyl isomerase [Defluviitaleaceae bacterium]|nr:peptidylprolyl isomerase [Defluviitaleaceae bacterium]